MSSTIFYYNEIVFYSLLVLFPFIETFWEFYLRTRQLQVLEQTPEVPDNIQDFIPPDAYRKARAYTLDKLEYKIITSIFGLVNSVTRLASVSFFGRWLDAVVFAMKFGFTYEDEIVVSMAFMFLTNFWSILMDIPFAIYYSYFIESRYGFNKQYLSGFLIDRFKYLIVTILIVLPVTATEVFVIKNGGKHFFCYLWLCSSFYTIALFNIIPKYIYPLLYSIKPLPDGPLKNSIEQLATAQGFPLSQLYIMEESSKSSHSSAYFTGTFQFSQIVLYDTLIYKKDAVTGKESGLKDNEVLAVLCHELGHWKFGHIQHKIVVTLVQLLCVCGIYAYLISYDPLYEAVGFPKAYKPALIGLLAVKLLLAPLETISNRFMNEMIRQQEYQADQFSTEVGYGEDLKKALCTIYKDNKIIPIYDWMYANWYLDHPTLLQRLEYIDFIQHRRQ